MDGHALIELPPREGSVKISVCRRAVKDYAAMALIKRSRKKTANSALAMDYSRGGVFHSFSDRVKIRSGSLVAASSLGKCPLARTARLSLEFGASMALVV